MKFRVVHSQDIYDVMRFDGSYHNAEANIYDGVIKKHSSHNLSYYCSEIFTSGRNKRIYTKPKFGYPFLSNSDVVSSNPFLSCKYSSKKYGYDESAVLKSGMIVTGRVGAIGQTAFIPSYVEKANAMGSDNIIRIVVKPQYNNGFIYAYLASKIGNLSFWKHATGGVQPFITDSMVGMLPIPLFPDDFQKKINDLVLESARLREEATENLNIAIKAVEEFIKAKYEPTTFKCGIVKFVDICNSLKLRIDPPALINEGVVTMKEIKDSMPYKLIKELNYIVRRPGIFKRVKVENGMPYIKGADLFLSNPFRRCEHLSLSRTPFIDEMTLREGQILITCAGAVGNAKIITKEYENKKAIGSQDIIRIDSPSETNADNLYCKEYLFAYLQQPFVYSYMQSMKYGSVIERIEPFHVESIPVVEPSAELSAKVRNLVQTYMECSYKAFCFEENAIDLVEQEIEKWNK